MMLWCDFQILPPCWCTHVELRDIICWQLSVYKCWGLYTSSTWKAKRLVQNGSGMIHNFIDDAYGVSPHQNCLGVAGNPGHCRRLVVNSRAIFGFVLELYVPDTMPSLDFRWTDAFPRPRSGANCGDHVLFPWATAFEHQQSDDSPCSSNPHDVGVLHLY